MIIKLSAFDYQILHSIRYVVTQCAVFGFSFSIPAAFPYTYCKTKSQSHGCRPAKSSKHGPISYEMHVALTKVRHELYIKPEESNAFTDAILETLFTLIYHCHAAWKAGTPRERTISLEQKTSTLIEMRKVTIYLLIDTSSLPSVDHF